MGKIGFLRKVPSTGTGNVDISGKVDKVQGKQLSTEDYTTAEKSKITDLDGNLGNKVDKVQGKQLSTEDYTTAEKTKLGDIAASATQNSTDLYLRDRANHTGTQTISSISGLQTELDKLNYAVQATPLTVSTNLNTFRNNHWIELAATANATLTISVGILNVIGQRVTFENRNANIWNLVAGPGVVIEKRSFDTLTIEDTQVRVLVCKKTTPLTLRWL
jgi:hypothetical protein